MHRYSVRMCQTVIALFQNAAERCHQTDTSSTNERSSVIDLFGKFGSYWKINELFAIAIALNTIWFLYEA